MNTKLQMPCDTSLFNVLFWYDKVIRASLWSAFVIAMMTMACSYAQADVAAEYYETHKRLKGDMSNVQDRLKGWEHVYGIIVKIDRAINGFKDSTYRQVGNVIRIANETFSGPINGMLEIANEKLSGPINNRVAVVIQELSQFKDNIVDQIFDSDDVIEDTQTDLGTE